MQNLKLKFTSFLFHFLLLNLLSAAGFLLSPPPAWARPEYALKTTTVNCNVCHLNPFGGGARTIFGKAFGSFGLKPAPYSKQDLFSADLRAVGYLPQSKKDKTSGFLLMNVQGTLNAPLSSLITEESEDSIKANLIINFTSSEMNPKSGESFILIEPNPKMQLVIGKFIRPYGLLTDEHRTFVRMQTETTSLNYESGIGLAHEVFDTWHFDLAYTNNASPGGGLSNEEPTWGNLFNLRWTPYFMPVMLGFSTSHTIRPAKTDSYAQSLYGGFSFDRATDYTIPVTITLEASKAQGWNGQTSYASYFFHTQTDAAYYNSIINKKSLGFYSQVIWNIKPHLSVLYKFDQLLFDEKYPADAFERHGIGSNWNMNSNLIFQVRMEYAKNGRKDVSQTTRSAVDSLYFLIRAWM